ncbi:phospholipid carrier-dependent glycosyltransferase [Nocardioides convexus]|uniref:phospholipid carrier-dependent glycosyltransferase n=1 Tax=Nocardioides convexus TaxID=2712224 RepID=UPI0024183EFB|nr:phospholipid carrier-dependent glycosyltransferase [Nocardioides convexus]
MTAVDEETRATAAPRNLTTLSTTATGRRVPHAITRALGPLHRLRGRERLVGWLGPIAVSLLALGLRLIGLGNPRRFSFDETYYAKDAWSLLNNGYIETYLTDVDGNAKTDINADILAGHTQNVWTGEPSLAVHPDVGKWLIALGEKAFGMDPVGWRIASVVAGALMVLVMCRLVRRLTGSTLLGCVAGLLLMLDGLHFVLSRLALLDIFLALFLLCGVHCIVADRQWLRARLAGRAAASEDGTLTGWGGRILFRPWLLAGGVCFGLAIGTKWTALPALGVFGLLCWFWSAGARRMLGIRWAVVKGAIADGIPAFVHLVVVAGLVYVATWGGWLVHAKEYEEHLRLDAVPAVHRPGPLQGRLLRRRQPRHHQEVADRGREGRHRPRRGVAVNALAVLLPPGRLHLPLPLPELLDALLPVQAVESAARQPPGRRRRHQRHPARHRRLRRGQGQHLHQAGAAAADAGAVVGRAGGAAVLRGDVDRRPGLALRARGGGSALDVAALVPVRRPADLHLLRDRDPAVHHHRPHLGDGHADRALTTTLHPSYDGGDRGRRVLHPGRDELRVVLADLDQPSLLTKGEWLNRIWFSRWV